MKLDPRSILEDLSPSQIDQLHAYCDLLTVRGVPWGVVAASDVDRMWERHILDSLRALSCLPSAASSMHLVDVGSGGGLPGIPLAIARPAARITLVEARARRAAFLELAVHTLGLEAVAVVAGRVEHAAANADVCTARAVAPPDRCWELARGVLAPGGRLLYWGGRTWSPGAVAPRVRAEICVESVFPWEGPIVIMTDSEPAAGPGVNPHERSI